MSKAKPTLRGEGGGDEKSTSSSASTRSNASSTSTSTTPKSRADDWETDSAGPIESIKSSTSSVSKSRCPTKSRVPVVQPEIVTVQKEHMTLLLAKCRNLETQVAAMKNLQLVIRDCYSQLDAEKKKSTKFQTAYMQAEHRLMEMVKLQLENSEMRHQLPFLSDATHSKPVGRATRLPVAEGEQHKTTKPSKARTVPADDRDSDVEIDDWETDGPSFIDVGPHESIKSSTSSGYKSVSRESFRKRDAAAHGPTVTDAILTAEDYEVLINQLQLELKGMKMTVKEQQNLLEAKGNRNIDALTAQLGEAIRKIEQLTSANKNKETLLQNYYQAYMALTKSQRHGQDSEHSDSGFSSSDASVDGMSREELAKRIREMNIGMMRMKKEHERSLVEQRGLYLKERENSGTLEAHLKTCQKTIEDLRSRPASLASGEFPLTMAELRERNEYLERSVEMHQHSQIKLSQEKERAIAALKIHMSENDVMKKERVERETQIRQLREQATKPNSEVNQLHAKLTGAGKQIEELRRSQKDCTNCKQWRKAYHHQKQKIDTVQKLLKDQEKLYLELQQQYQQQQQQVQQQQQMQQQQQQQEGSYNRSVSHARSGTGSHSSLYHQQQQMPAQLTAVRSNAGGSNQGGGGSSIYVPVDEDIDDDEKLECPRCLKAFTLDDVEKYQRHMQKCQDE